MDNAWLPWWGKDRGVKEDVAPYRIDFEALTISEHKFEQPQ